MSELPDSVIYELSDLLNALARHLGSFHRKSRGWSNDGSAGAFSRLVRIAITSIAVADGPLTSQEKRVLCILFPGRNLRRDMSGSFVAGAMKPPDVEKIVALFGTFMSANAKQGRADNLEADLIVRLMQHAGTLICACDDETTLAEAEALTNFMVSLRTQAQKVKRLQTPIPALPDVIDDHGPVQDHAVTRLTSKTSKGDEPNIEAVDEEKPEPELTSEDAKDAPIKPKVVSPVAPAPLRELDSLVGLANVKQEVETLANIARVLQLRRKRGMVVPKLGYHLVFTGNPGTGKTTVARILASLYGRLGIVRSGHLVEVDRSGLVGGFLGQTAIKVNEVVKSALGGVLFIDEAYSLAGKREDPYGAEAIEALLKAMEDHRDDFVLIVAGYTEPMQVFLDSNPGFQSRFSRRINFPDYSASEMKQIFEGMARSAGFALAAEAEAVLSAMMTSHCEAPPTPFANARDVRNLFEETIGRQANRLADDHWITDTDLRIFTAEDISSAADILRRPVSTSVTLVD